MKEQELTLTVSDLYCAMVFAHNSGLFTASRRYAKAIIGYAEHAASENDTKKHQYIRYEWLANAIAVDRPSVDSSMEPSGA